MEILIDFDGTCVKHNFPHTDGDVGAVPVLKKLTNAGHKLILFTMRSNKQNVDTSGTDLFPLSGNFLDDAVNWFREKDIPLYGINTNPMQTSWTDSPKAYGQLIIDDIALGIPLVQEPGSRPYVDWIAVEKLLKEKHII